jgi:hyperosmotically inducible protein
MTDSKGLILSCLTVALLVGSACTPETEEQTKQVTEEVKDKARELAEDAKEKTGELAGKVADTGKEVLSATGEAISDGWITTKVKAKFADEKLLKDSNITVETNNRAVTLTGTVASAGAKARATTIAGGTEGVERVIDELLVKTGP